MRSSVSYMLSHGSGEPIMSHPDYEQHAHHHGCLLVLVRGIGQSKPRSLQKIFERLQRVNNVKITDSAGQVRDIWVRYVQEHPIENNDWGDFQTHRRLIGLVTVGKFDNQTELNELCRVHESLKVKYSSTLFDSRCILFGPNGSRNGSTRRDSNDRLTDDSNARTSLGGQESSSTDNSLNAIGDSAVASAAEPIQENDNSTKLEDIYTTPTNFKSRAFFYPEYDPCENLETSIVEFINALFWVLESKRLERSREKIDKVSLLVAPFEKRDFIGLDMETRNNRKRLMGRVTKNLADLTLQAGMVSESLTLFQSASETLRAISDSLWLGAAFEGLCAASAILLYPHCRLTMVLQRNASLQENSPGRMKNRSSSQDNLSKQQQPKKTGLVINFETESLSKNNNNANSSSVSSSTSSVSSMLSSSSSAGTPSSSSDRLPPRDCLPPGIYPSGIVPPNEIAARYRDAIINYSKYRHAGVIETEAALKAARLCIELGQNLEVAMFLQNVLYIDLNMTEQKRVQRFETLTELYQRVGYNRKAAFYQRLAAWRHVAQNNPNPDWAQSYRLMLESFPGYRMSLDPLEMILQNAGWPCLQIDLVLQLVEAARRLGHSALATRHMTFLLQTMWNHLSPNDQKEFAFQLQNLSAQCEGAPVPLVLENGTVIPPANLTDLPQCEFFQLADLPPHMRPHKIVADKIDCGPFLFTPIHYSSSVDRKTIKNKSKMAFQWVQHDLCEVSLKLKNPLPFELRIDDMRLLSNGIVFESLPQSVVLPTNVPTTVTLHGTPIEHGILDIQGYSTHTLGVKSNCRLKNMRRRKFCPNFVVDVIPALPKLEITTSLPQSATFGGMANSDSVIVSASVTLYNGETTECVITLTNNSNTPIEFIEESIHSALDSRIQSQIFQWSREDLQSKLPILPNSFIDIKVCIFAEADFLGPISGSAVGITSLTPSHQNPSYHGDGGPQSLIGAMSNLSVSGGGGAGTTSLPSRMSSPVNIPPRRTELTSSFRSNHSGHSSLASMSLVAAGAPSLSRHIEAQFRFRYSGGDGYREGYCRQCSVLFNLEFLASAQVTNWDVLPAETPTQFYLVLDVINLTAQEMSLNYTATKNILIEAKESCRVPIPVERCPLDRLLAEEIQSSADHTTSILSGATDVDLAEKACSEHVSDNVKLKWTLTGTETHGITSLKGITLSSTMLSLITVAPLHWEIFIDNDPLTAQAEINCSAGQNVTFGIKITNMSPTTLHHLTLTIQFYQDFQNGIHNYKLETRVIISGPNQTVIATLNQNDSVFHECSAIFFTPGRFKADIQCCADASRLTGGVLQQSAIGITASKALNADLQIWRYIPPIEITVTE